MPMFSFPNPYAVLSIFYPIGEYKTKYVAATGRQKHGKRVPLGPVKARVLAAREVLVDLFYAAGQAAVAATAFVGALEVRERFFLP